jgi:hypothetical protein
MKRITANPERLSYREPPGWGVLFTLPLFVAGLGLGIFLLKTFGADLIHKSSWGTLIGGVVLLFVGYKAVCCAIEWFGCVGVTIDRERGVVVPKWGFFLPLPLGSQPIRDCDALFIEVIVTIHYRNGSETFREYTYVLSLFGNGRRVRIGRSREYARVRAMAEDVGRFLGLPVVDNASGEPVVLRPETLGLSIKEKARVERPREVSCDKTPPAGLRSKYRVEGNRVVIELPRLEVMGCLVVWFLLLLALFGLLAYIFVDSKGNWAPVAMFGGIGGLVLAILYGAVAPQQTILEVSPEALEIANRGLLCTSRRRLEADRIRELRLEAASIVAITDRETVMLASLVSDPERAWIHSVLHQVLAA